MELDLTALERELCRIPEVTAARVVSEATGEIVEVHILAISGKQPKQVVRDVQSVAMAAFGVDIDRRVVSVVQLENGNGSTRGAAVAGEVTPDEITPDEITPNEITPNEITPDEITPDEITLPPTAVEAPTRRICVEGVGYARNGFRCTVEVALRRGDERAVGTAEGSAATGSASRLVASATLSALADLQPEAARADIETATVMSVGERRVATASVVLVVPPHEELLVGSAVVRGAGDHDAMARAVLDATNRRLHKVS